MAKPDMSDRLFDPVAATPSPGSLVGKTVQEVRVQHYASGFGGAMEVVAITTTDGETVTLTAGSYAIPGEACIYAS